MKRTTRRPPTGQRDVKRFLCESPLELCVCDRGAPFVQARLDGVFGLVDQPPGLSPLFGRKLPESLHCLGQRPCLAEVAGLCLFESGRVGDRRKQRDRLLNDSF